MSDVVFIDKTIQSTDQIKNDIINAKKYMEGRGIAIEVKDGNLFKSSKDTQPLL